MRSARSSFHRLAALAPVVLASSGVLPLAAQTRPEVPTDIQVPAGQRAYLVAAATGTQNYICLPSATGVAWAFLGPQATLFDAQGNQVATHFLSPNPVEGGIARATWQHSRDTSVVWATAVKTYAEPDYVTPGSIPWLLLEVKGTQSGGRSDKLSATTYIQRLNTSGGVAPAAGCEADTDIGKRVLVPYTTDYVFYRARNQG